MRVLFGAHPTVGHTQALRAVAGEFRRRGHQTVFMTSQAMQVPRWLPVPQPLRAAAELVTSLRADGPVETLPLSLEAQYAGAQVARSRGYLELEWALRLFTAGAVELAQRVAAIVRRDRAELVVADFAFFGAWLGAELAGVPHVAVYHSGLPFPTDDGVPFGSGLRAEDMGTDEWHKAKRRLAEISGMVDDRLGDARSELGLPQVPPDLLARPYAQRLNVMTTFELLEPSRTGLAERAAGPVLYAGPCLEPRRRAPGDDFPWSRLEGSKRTVLVSLGTVFNDQPRLLELLLNGVHQAGARAVVAAGAAVKTAERVARTDDVVVRFAPQLELLERVDAFLSHGGNNSVNEALRAGAPLVVMPFGAEQRSNAQRVSWLGVGESLGEGRVDAVRVAAALERAFARRAQAKSLAAQLPKEDGTQRILAALGAGDSG